MMRATLWSPEPVEAGRPDPRRVQYFRIEPEGLAPCTNPGTDYTVTAFVDPDNGLIEMTPAGADGRSFEFLRQPPVADSGP